MKYILLIMLVFGIVSCSEDTTGGNSQSSSAEQSTKVGFYCEPTGTYGFVILVIYDGEYVSSFHDVLHLRDQGWNVTKLNSGPFEFHYGNKKYPAMEWYVPKSKWTIYKSKRHLHDLRKKQIDGEVYKTLLVTIQEYDGEEDLKISHNCFPGDISQMNAFVEDRKISPFKD